MKRIFVLAITAVSALLLNTSCMNTVNTAENQEKTMNPEFVKNQRVVTDGFLRDRLVVDRIDQQTLPSGLLRIQATLRSTRVGFWDWLRQGDTPYKIAYQFSWFNSAGMAVTTATSTWIEKDVIPGDTIWIQAVAPNEDCKDFMLKMKELDN
jgi:hypothetical protein